MADCLSRAVENLEMPIIKDRGVRVSQINHYINSNFGFRNVRNKYWSHRQKFFNKFTHLPKVNKSDFQDVLDLANQPDRNYTTSTLQQQKPATEMTSNLPTPQHNYNWITAYSSCLNFSDLYKFLNDHIIPPNNPKFIISSAHNFFVVDKLLYFSDAKAKKLLCVPELMRENLITQAHGGTIGNHFSTKKVFLQLSQQFFWPNMRTDIESYIVNCQECLFNRIPRNNLPPLNPVVTVKPLELICIDLGRKRKGQQINLN